MGDFGIVALQNPLNAAQIESKDACVLDGGGADFEDTRLGVGGLFGHLISFL
jgi:hypothetical protein